MSRRFAAYVDAGHADCWMITLHEDGYTRYFRDGDVEWATYTEPLDDFETLSWLLGKDPTWLTVA